ncbi:MAG: FAD-dependent thymidylate synthase [Acholeplasmatales bacterium]|nr:FAD-dependent thymidylate synthase [Methanobrevibacter sp.]MBP5446461.1 FAD-dependent thymidylate synthase [Acholeplasmatales bacterium]
MELIRPSFEIWEQKYDNPVEDMYKHIARCTRVCYQSEKKDNKETDEDFVKRVILRKEPWSSEANHLSVLENGTVYLYLEVNPENAFKSFNYPSALFTAHYNWSDVVGHIAAKYRTNNYSKAITIITKDNKAVRRTYITTNFRVIIENNWLDDIQFICAPTVYHIKRITVSFITNIGVSREFNRHRVDSIAEESTRYCNYNKRNDGQLKIGLPAWFLDEEHLPYLEGHTYDTVGDYAQGILSQEDNEIVNTWCDMDFYLCSITFSQWCYNMLIAKGWTAQMAREVLPLATKSQLIHTAFEDDWKHFFKLRSEGVSGAPHPNAKLVADKLLKEFNIFLKNMQQ